MIAPMYSRLLLNLCERSLYRASSNVRLNIKRSSHHAASKEETKRQEEIVSTIFPDYKVIYVFPFIKQACGINVVKRRFTKFIGVATPVIVGLHLTSILSFDMTFVAIACGILVTIWLHSIGFLCNNLTGYVYLKSDEEKAILSYIDYWGRRINLEKPLHEIIPISDNPMSITDFLYRKIMFSSSEQSLKINIKFGRIIDSENFKCILGSV